MCNCCDDYLYNEFSSFLGDEYESETEDGSSNDGGQGGSSSSGSIETDREASDSYETSSTTSIDDDASDHAGRAIPTNPSLEEAIQLVRGGAYRALVWNSCYGGGPCLSDNGCVLYRQLKGENFDPDARVILMEVLRRLGPGEATEQCSAFSIGLIKTEYSKYTTKSEYDGWEGMSTDNHRFVRAKLRKHLKKNGLVTKDEYDNFERESWNMEIIGVEGTRERSGWAGSFTLTNCMSM